MLRAQVVVCLWFLKWLGRRNNGQPDSCCSRIDYEEQPIFHEVGLHTPFITRVEQQLAKAQCTTRAGFGEIKTKCWGVMMKLTVKDAHCHRQHGQNHHNNQINELLTLTLRGLQPDLGTWLQGFASVSLRSIGKLDHWGRGMRPGSDRVPLWHKGVDGRLIYEQSKEGNCPQRRPKIITRFTTCQSPNLLLM